MGNNTSTEEKVGGGLLTGIGTALAFTPIGPFTSTWMIPIGAGLMTGKEQPVGVGATYADDGNGFQPYIGDLNNAIPYREKQYEKEVEERTKKIMLEETKKQDALKLNTYLKEEYEKEPTDTQWCGINYYVWLYGNLKNNNNNYYKLFKDSETLEKITNLSIPTNLSTIYPHLYLKLHYCKGRAETISKNLEFINNNVNELKKINSEKWEKVFAELFVGTVYAMNASEAAQDFMDETGCMMYASYACKVDESMKLNAYKTMCALKMAFNNLKDIWHNHLKISQIEKYQQKMYQQASFAKKSEVNPFVKKYGIHIDIEEYKLNKQQKIKKVEEYLNESDTTTFNSYKHHEIINKMMKECIEIIVE